MHTHLSVALGVVDDEGANVGQVHALVGGEELQPRAPLQGAQRALQRPAVHQALCGGKVWEGAVI